VYKKAGGKMCLFFVLDTIQTMIIQKVTD